MRVHVATLQSRYLRAASLRFTPPLLCLPRALFAPPASLRTRFHLQPQALCARAAFVGDNSATAARAPQTAVSPLCAGRLLRAGPPQFFEPRRISRRPPRQHALAQPDAARLRPPAAISPSARALPHNAPQLAAEAGTRRQHSAVRAASMQRVIRAAHATSALTRLCVKRRVHNAGAPTSRRLPPAFARCAARSMLARHTCQLSTRTSAEDSQTIHPHVSLRIVALSLSQRSRNARGAAEPARGSPAPDRRRTHDSRGPRPHCPTHSAPLPAPDLHANIHLEAAVPARSSRPAAPGNATPVYNSPATRPRGRHIGVFSCTSCPRSKKTNKQHRPRTRRPQLPRARRKRSRTPALPRPAQGLRPACPIKITDARRLPHTNVAKGNPKKTTKQVRAYGSLFRNSTRPGSSFRILASPSATSCVTRADEIPCREAIVR